MSGISDQSVRKATAPDGTEIAYWRSGEGRPLVLVHGAPADHTRWRPLLPHLEPHALVCAVDRRGRGESGDGDVYDLAREFEDVAAVVDQVAHEFGSTVDLYGHSFGGLCAFGAAAVTSNVGRLVLYEGWPVPDPSVLSVPPEVGERLDALLGEGRPEAALEAFMRGYASFSEDEIRALKEHPSWPARVAATHALPRELRASAEAFLDAERAAMIAAPTLLLTGTESGDPSAAVVDAVAAALPDARTVALEGQGHLADILAPEVFAAAVLSFLREGRGGTNDVGGDGFEPPAPAL